MSVVGRSKGPASSETATSSPDLANRLAAKAARCAQQISRCSSGEWTTARPLCALNPVVLTETAYDGVVRR